MGFCHGAWHVFVFFPDALFGSSGELASVLPRTSLCSRENTPLPSGERKSVCANIVRHEYVRKLICATIRVVCFVSGGGDFHLWTIFEGPCDKSALA